MSPFVETVRGTDRVTMNLGGHVPPVPSAICSPAKEYHGYSNRMSTSHIFFRSQGNFAIPVAVPTNGAEMTHCTFKYSWWVLFTVKAKAKAIWNHIQYDKYTDHVANHILCNTVLSVVNFLNIPLLTSETKHETRCVGLQLGLLYCTFFLGNQWL